PCSECRAKESSTGIPPPSGLLPLVVSHLALATAHPPTLPTRGQFRGDPARVPLSPQVQWLSPAISRRSTHASPPAAGNSWEPRIRPCGIPKLSHPRWSNPVTACATGQ